MKYRLFLLVVFIAALIGGAPERVLADEPAPPAASPDGVSAEAKDEARRRYEKGIHLYEEENNAEGALVEFERAYKLAPSYKILFNIGQASRVLREYVGSLRAFEGYLEGGGDKIPEGRRAEVAKEIESLRGLIGHIKVVVDEDGSSVLVDGNAVGDSPLAAPVIVNIGKVKVSAAKNGRSASRTVSVAGGDELTVELSLASVSAPFDSATAQAKQPASFTLLDVGWAASGTLAAGALITGFLALSSSNALNESVYVGQTPTDEMESLSRRTSALALTTDILAGAAIATAGATLYSVFSDP